MTPPGRTPRALSIAGSDSGGGAGIQADLKAFAACGVHGMTAITALTAQNTVGVSAIHQVPGDMIVAQVRAVAEDIGIDVVKIGMLGDVATIEAVARALDEVAPEAPVVLDPVMVSESGAALLQPEARASLIELLLPRASVITPNVPEARALAQPRLGRDIQGGREYLDQAEGPSSTTADPAPVDQDPVDQDPADQAPADPAPADQDPADPAPAAPAPADLARELHRLGPAAVVVTGGHREQAIDTFFDGRRLVEIPGPRHPGAAAHGSGCTHASVLAARLAWGDDPLQAARVAKLLAAAAVRDGLVDVGAGSGPVHVLGALL